MSYSTGKSSLFQEQEKWISDSGINLLFGEIQWIRVHIPSKIAHTDFADGEGNRPILRNARYRPISTDRFTLSQTLSMTLTARSVTSAQKKYLANPQPYRHKSSVFGSLHILCFPTLSISPLPPWIIQFYPHPRSCQSQQRSRQWETALLSPLHQSGIAEALKFNNRSVS